MLSEHTTLRLYTRRQRDSDMCLTEGFTSAQNVINLPLNIFYRPRFDLKTRVFSGQISMMYSSIVLVSVQYGLHVLCSFHSKISSFNKFNVGSDVLSFY